MALPNQSRFQSNERIRGTGKFDPLQLTHNPCSDCENGVFPSDDQSLAEIVFSESDFDPDLRLVVERWDGLSVDLKQAIIKMVRRGSDTKNTHSPQLTRRPTEFGIMISMEGLLVVLASGSVLLKRWRMLLTIAGWADPDISGPLWQVYRCC